MRVSVLVVGKARLGGIAGAIADYETRAARYWPLDVIEVKESSSRARTPVQVMDEEAERLLAKLPDAALTVACAPGGEELDSDAFASFVAAARDSARSLCFLIGGAHGLGTAALARASRRLALAPWTLPHDLARLVLAEQLYRAGTIVRGEPYHK